MSFPRESLKKKTISYFPAIDGLRLLASINIVLLHLSSSNALEYTKGWTIVSPIINAPAFAAGLFFVLAGFLFGSKFSDPDRRVPVMPFIFTRIVKLYRLHFLMTFLMFFVLVFKLSGAAEIPTSWEALSSCVSAGLANMANPFRSLFLHLSLTWSIVPDLGMKLNEPSWALSSFFLCYAITPFAAKTLFNLSSKKLWILFGIVFVPGIIWGLIFGVSGDLWFADYGAKYRFFHMFAPIRIFEYLFGMLLFRLYQTGAFSFLQQKYASGLSQIILLALLYLSLFFLNTASSAWNYINHHSLPILIYGLLIISLTSGKGLLARFFCIKPIRAIGRASFYPYLIHLPLISIAWGLCNLNTPKNTILFLIFIYAISTFYMEFKKSRKKKKTSSFEFKSLTL